MSATIRRALGQYITPAATVDYMVQRVLPFLGQGDRILEPTAGDGAFLQGLLRAGVEPERIDAWDLQPGHPAIRQGDSLLRVGGRYQAVIGNPPYKSRREAVYLTSREPVLRDLYGEVGLKNTYALFLVNGILNLLPGGVLCFLLQDSFLTNVYYRSLRRFLFDHCRILEITLAPASLFHSQGADVRPCILLLQRQSGPLQAAQRRSTPVRLVDRLQGEEQYLFPPRTLFLPQERLQDLEGGLLPVGVPSALLGLLSGPRLSSVAEGGTGISTGNDRRYLRRQQKDGPTPEGIPFYKNGGGFSPFYYATPYRMHPDWERHSQGDPNFQVRNRPFFYREGITCSSMGVRFSAAYLPPGSLFGVNTNLFFRDRETLFYLLGYLNSTLARYLLRAVLNRTNMITAGYVKRLPYREPDADRRRAIARLAEETVSTLHSGIRVDLRGVIAVIDREIEAVFDLLPEERREIHRFVEGLPGTL